MNKARICILFLLFLSALHQHVQSQNTSAGFIEGYVPLKLRQDMMNFFCHTLEQNYGKADGKAIIAMIEGLRHYKDTISLMLTRRF